MAMARRTLLRAGNLSEAMAMAGRTLLRAGQRQALPSNHAFAAILQQEGWATQATKDLSKNTSLAVGRQNDKDDVQRGTAATVVYYGASSDMLMRVKMLFVATWSFDVGLCLPAFLTSPDVSATMTSICFLSASTTGMWYWLTRPYIHKLTWNPGDKEVEVVVVPWMAKRITRKIRLSDIRIHMSTPNAL